MVGSPTEQDRGAVTMRDCGFRLNPQRDTSSQMPKVGLRPGAVCDLYQRLQVNVCNGLLYQWDRMQQNAHP
jgi:hypothetical protein